MWGCVLMHVCMLCVHIHVSVCIPSVESGFPPFFLIHKPCLAPLWPLCSV